MCDDSVVVLEYFRLSILIHVNSKIIKDKQVMSKTNARTRLLNVQREQKHGKYIIILYYCFNFRNVNAHVFVSFVNRCEICVYINTSVKRNFGQARLKIKKTDVFLYLRAA